MKKELIRLVKQFNTLHTIKHTSITIGLTVIGGPWGLAMGLTYCLGDTIKESKKFKDEDFVEFIQSLPPETLESLKRIVKSK